MQGIKIKLAGREYSLSPPGREELKLLDKYVMEHRQSILQLIKPHLAGLDKDQQQFLLRQALEMEAAKPIGGVSQLEYASVLDTRDGYAFLFWLLARSCQSNRLAGPKVACFRSLASILPRSARRPYGELN